MSTASDEVIPQSAQRPALALAAQFSWHIVIGTLTFMLVGLAGVSLHRFVEWIEAQGIPTWMVFGSRSVEYGVFAIDLLLFATFIVRTGWSFFTRLLKVEVR